MTRWIVVSVIAVLLAITHFTTFRAGKAAVRAEWDAAKAAQQQVDLQAGIDNAKETQRRLARQKESQDANTQDLAAALAAAGRNADAADGLRAQLADAAQRWRTATGDPAIGEECKAAGDAISVLADVLGRADRRAGELAAIADTARAAGLQCERDYDALTTGTTQP